MCIVHERIWIWCLLPFNNWSTEARHFLSQRGRVRSRVAALPSMIWAAHCTGVQYYCLGKTGERHGFHVRLWQTKGSVPLLNHPESFPEFYVPVALCPLLSQGGQSNPTVRSKLAGTRFSTADPNGNAVLFQLGPGPDPEVRATKIGLDLVNVAHWSRRPQIHKSKFVPVP
jgi:hypothetical protein